MDRTPRIERDALGEREIPPDVYWGIQTLRAMENFPISGLRADRELIAAYGRIKAAAAATNAALGLLDAERARAIEIAALELAEGRHDAQLVVDVFQAGAGTSLHMNVNEVVANRALELLGEGRGAYGRIHPNDHVNMAQSTNDTFPTALRMACLARARWLREAAAELVAALVVKADELADVLTSGRTHLQDAVPIRYGQVFGAYAHVLEAALAGAEAARARLLEVPIGGTAVGTGINAHPDYAEHVVARLAELASEPLRPAPDPVAAISSMADLIAFSGTLRTLAIELGRIADDLRLLASGPATGLGDLRLPAVQPGSSIMPGKVNPSIPEMVNMVCYQVQGNDQTVALCGRAGQLQLDVMMPGIAHALLGSLAILPAAMRVLAARCIAGIDADRARCQAHVEGSAALATLLSPLIGYTRASELTKEALASGQSVLALIRSRGILSPRQLAELLDPRRVTAPGLPPGGSEVG